MNRNSEFLHERSGSAIDANVEADRGRPELNDSEAERGLQANQARYFDPSTGRWTSQ